MKGWRTLLFNMALAAVGAIQATGLVDVIPQAYVGIAMIAVGAIGAALRSITDTKAGDAK